MNLNDYLIPDFDLTGNLTTEDTLYGLLSDDEEITGYLGLIEDIALSELSDVTLTSPVNGQVLKYKDGTWVNANETGGGNNDYNLLDNKPSINAVPLTGNKTTAELGLFSGDYDDLTNKPTLAAVATTGNYNDLTNRPTIPAAQVNADWDAVAGVSQILNKPSLASVATSGDYDDLINTPTLATVATTGDYDDLIDTPTIPDITTTNISSDYTFTKTSGSWEIHSFAIYKTGNTYQAQFTLKGDGTSVAAGADGCVYSMSTGDAPSLFSFFIAMVGTSLCLGFYNSGDSTWHFRPINAAVTLNVNSRLNFSGVFIK